MKGFYIHIDAILDTRAGVISRMDSEALPNIVRNHYHQRKSDFFDGIDRDLFKEIYDRHEMETLEYSTITNVFFFLYPQITDYLKESIAQEMMEHEKPTVDVNVWPYKFTEEEKSVLRSLVYINLSGIIGVNVIDVPITELTPSICGDTYLMMIMYDYNEWLNAHDMELIRNPKPWLGIVAPMVYFNSNPDEEGEAMEMLQRGINVLSILEASIAIRVGLRFVNVEVFSIRYPDERMLKPLKKTTYAARTIEELDAELEKQRQAGKT